MWAVELVVMLAMVTINSVFAAYEIALASVSIARLNLLARENRPGAAAAVRMKRSMESSLAVVQLGITLVGAVAAATGGAGAEENIEPLLLGWGVSGGAAQFLAIALVVLPLTVVTIVFGELVPKVFALRNKEWVCLRLSPMMKGFALLAWPVVWLLETLTLAVMRGAEWLWRSGGKAEPRPQAPELEELHAITALARAARLIGPREERIILGASRLPHRPVREAMLPVDQLSTLDLTSTPAESLVTAHLDMHTRFPVCERPGDPQSIIGYVNFKDIVALMRLSPQDPNLRAVLRPIPSVPDTQPLDQCLERLMREHTHIALVRDASGRVVGMITLEDIIEELVGDIEDEYDRLPAHGMRSGDGWVVGGGISLARLRELTGMDLGADRPPGEARNLSEWLRGHLGRPVRGGDVLARGGTRVVVRKVRRQDLMEAQVSRTGSAEPAPAALPGGPGP